MRNAITRAETLTYKDSVTLTKNIFVDSCAMVQITPEGIIDDRGIKSRKITREEENAEAIGGMRRTAISVTKVPGLSWMSKNIRPIVENIARHNKETFQKVLE